MWPRNGTTPLLWITGMLLLTSVTVAGCAQVRVVDTAPGANTAIPLATSPSAGSQAHDLAILAVDFDPPLNYQQLIVRPQSVELLVAVENTGQRAEQNVTVRAELSSPEDPELFLTQGASMVSIAPGEVQVVRFGHLGEIPYHRTYHLEVVVEPVDGESDLSDNRKAFDVEIDQDRVTP